MVRIAAFPGGIRSRADSIRKTLTRRSGTWGECLTRVAAANRPAASRVGCVTELVLLGNIALRTGKRLDGCVADAFPQRGAANSFLKEPYHNGWSLDSL